MTFFSTNSECREFNEASNILCSAPSIRGCLVLCPIWRNSCCCLRKHKILIRWAQIPNTVCRSGSSVAQNSLIFHRSTDLFEVTVWRSVFPNLKSQPKGFSMAVLSLGLWSEKIGWKASSVRFLLCVLVFHRCFFFSNPLSLSLSLALSLLDATG